MSDRPNVLMVIADQHNPGWLGSLENSQAITPNLDRFAAEGVRFDAAYCQNPICTPSRVSVLSGQYCHNTGIYGLSGPTPQRLPSLMGHLKGHGYRTAAFGKLHLPHEGDGNWLWRDLDRFGDAYENAQGQMGVSDFFTELEALGLRDKEDSWHNPHNYGPGALTNDAMPSEMPYEHTQEMWSARQALRFIDEADGDEPFCIQVAFQKPHHPLLPQPKFWEMYPEDLELPATVDQDPSHRPPHFQKAWQALRSPRQWTYGKEGEDYHEGARRAWRGTLACVTQCDDVFGHLLAGLEQRGLTDNTIVVYHSDHGAYHGIHGIIEKAPGICSDAVCRVPMLWRLPGATKAGHVSNALVENVDVAPTITSLCGVPAMDWADGVDLSGVLRGESDSVKELAVTENPLSKAIRWGKWRFVHYPRSMFDGEDWGELYDMQTDPDETRNLYFDPSHRETVEACRRRLFDWLVETTRVVTCHPPVEPRAKTPGSRFAGQHYVMAADGKETNEHGPAARKIKLYS